MMSILKRKKSMRILTYIYLTLALLFAVGLNLLKAQQLTTIITNATLHIGNGQLIEKGVLVMEKGKIVDIGKSQTSFYKNAKVIDASGKHIYPGIICMNNFMGLNEIDAVRATHDYDENGQMNPNARSLIAYNTDSKIVPTATFNGILFTQCVPQGGVISGTSSLMKTTGWNWEDAVYKADEGIHLNWPEMNVGQDTDGSRAKNLEKRVNEIKEFFAEAQQYSKLQKPESFNARLDAMRGLFNRTENLYLHVQFAKSIISSINYFKQNYPDIKLVLVGATDAYLLIDLIKTYSIPVVLSNIHRLPSHSFEDVDQPYKTPSLLYKEGIEVAIGQAGSWEARNVMYTAGTAAAYGLSKEEALQCISLTPAKIMGVDKQIGSLETGKDASFLISEGDLLDMKSSKVEAAYLQGEAIDLKNDQVKFYEKYKKKYGLK